MPDIEAIYSDPTICDPAVFASWSGQSPLYARVMDHIFAADRQRESATNQSEDISEPRGRYSRSRNAA